MNIETLEREKLIIFKALVGSHAYGTSTPTSDTDYRGIFIAPLRKRVTILPTILEVGQEKPTDEKYYEISKYFSLAADCNPNIIELLFMPEDCIKVCTPQMRYILDNRHLFISKKAYHTFSGYAYAQIKKAKGENKWVNNPKPETPPQREDFCWVIPFAGTDITAIWNSMGVMPARPIHVATFRDKHNPSFDLSDFHVAALEHVPDTYRMYWYGDKSKGIFRDGNLACESIPMDDEYGKFWGLLVYNDQEYQKAMLDWKNYWTWMKERNPNRWVAQETGAVDYDCKNFQHCMRLLISGEAILKTGQPIIRFEGNDLKYLRDIRAGYFKYEQLMETVEIKMAELKETYEKSTLPHSPDRQAINALFQEIVFDGLQLPDKDQ